MQNSELTRHRRHASAHPSWLDAWLERGIWGLVLAILIFGPLATGAVRSQDFFVIQWMTVGIAVLWAARLWINPGLHIFWPPICWSVVLFAAYAACRYLQADIEYVARQEFLRVLVYAVLFLAIANNVSRQGSIRLISLCLIVLATVISFYAIYQFATNSDYVWHFIKPRGYLKRGSGTYICPNHLAGFLEMILPIALAFTVAGRFRPVAKIILGYSALAILAGIALTVSRAAWFATSLSLIAFILFLALKRKLWIQMAALATLLALAGLAFFLKVSPTDSRDGYWSLERQRADIRFKLWKPAYEMWKDHVWLGVGPAHFDQRFRAYRPADDQLQVRPDRVHNDVLNTLADWGVVGAALVASAWILLAAGTWRSWKFLQRSTPPTSDEPPKNSNKVAFILGACTGLLALLIHSWFDFNLHIPANAIAAVALMAMISTYTRYSPDGYWLRRRWLTHAAATVAAVAACAYIGSQALRRSRETRLLTEASEISKGPLLRAKALERAFAAEPKNPDTAFAVGEAYRQLSWEGSEDDYQLLAKQAIEWYQRSIRLNPHDPFPHLRLGMCLDWIGDHAGAYPHFRKACDLDPNGSITTAHLGWHYVQVQDYTSAKRWLEKSLGLNWSSNQVASTYLRVVNDKLSRTSR